MLDFDKMNGLIPAIIQDNDTRKGDFLQPY